MAVGIAKVVGESAHIMECGGKRSATPPSHARSVLRFPKPLARPKAVSPLRSATAVHDVTNPAMPRWLSAA